jgi:predicted exporter
VAGAATLWVLPHVVPANWRPRPPPRWAWLSPSPAQSWRPAWRWALVAIATACVIALAWQRPWWDDDLASMSPLPASAKSTDAQLRAALGAPDVRYVLTVNGESREDALRRSEALRPALAAAVASRQLGAFDLVSDLVPSEDTQARRRRALPDPQRLRADLDSALAGLPFRPGVFDAFIDGVARARDAPPVMPETFKDSALGFKIDGLLRQDGARWYVVVPLTDVRDAAGLARALPADARLIDLRGETSAMMAAYRARGLEFSAIGLVLIYAVLVVGLRSPARAAKVLVPIVLAAIAVGSILVAFVEPLTVFHYVALLLTIGIGVNYALLMASPVARDDRPAMWRTLAVVSGTALVTFGVLAFAHAPVLHAIGITVTIGVIVSLVFAAVLVRPAEANAAR